MITRGSERIDGKKRSIRNAFGSMLFREGKRLDSTGVNEAHHRPRELQKIKHRERCR